MSDQRWNKLPAFFGPPLNLSLLMLEVSENEVSRKTENSHREGSLYGRAPDHLRRLRIFFSGNYETSYNHFLLHKHIVRIIEEIGDQQMKYAAD